MLWEVTERTHTHVGCLCILPADGILILLESTLEAMARLDKQAERESTEIPEKVDLKKVRKRTSRRASD